MSAQDYPLPAIRLSTPLPHIRKTGLRLFADGMARMVHEMVSRHHLWKLAVLDDDQLRDYGIDRFELARALEAPLTVSAAQMLARVRARRASEPLVKG